MKHVLVCSLIIIGLAASTAHAQQMWRTVPKIAVIVRKAYGGGHIAMGGRPVNPDGSGFRLGAVARTVRPIPEEAVQQLSTSVLSGRGNVASFPSALSDLPGDITIVLAASEFVSFASPFNQNSKKVIGIRGASFSPMSLPNVPRNVIAHELGHAIGLRHNSDPAMLMCGRPATCRPGLFQSAQPRMFPLRSDEKSFLLSMYPSQWKAR